MNPAHIAVARQSLLLASAPEPLVQVVLASARMREFERGATVFMQGERASAIYIVAEGWVKLYRIAPNGTEAVVDVFTKGHSFGEAVAFRHDIYPVSAEAVTECSLIRIEADQFLHLLHDNPEVVVMMLSATYVHLHSLVMQIQALKAQTGAQRVAEFLLELAPCEEGTCEVVLPYDKFLIAGRLGMKPESLSRAFAKLREHGVAIRQNNAAIDDIAVLRAFAAEDPASAWSR